jgi:hypothetical protein
MAQTKFKIPIEITRSSRFNPIPSSAEISRRTIAESYRKYGRHTAELSGNELTQVIETWKQRMARNAGKYFVVGGIYALATGAWFALKS